METIKTKKLKTSPAITLLRSEQLLDNAVQNALKITNGININSVTMALIDETTTPTIPAIRKYWYLFISFIWFSIVLTPKEPF
jgi:hypothetical protein